MQVSFHAARRISQIAAAVALALSISALAHSAEGRSAAEIQADGVIRERVDPVELMDASDLARCLDGRKA